MVLPWRLDPGLETGAEVVGQIAGIIVNVLELTKLDKTLQGKVVKEYLKVLEDVAPALSGVPGQDRNGWRVFIETAEYSDAKEEGNPDLDEDGNPIELRERSWVEIRGVRHPRNRNYEAGDYDEVYGYKTAAQAYSAGLIAVGIWPNRMPEYYIDQACSVDAYGRHYWVDSDLLDLLTGINDILERIGEVISPD